MDELCAGLVHFSGSQKWGTVTLATRMTQEQTRDQITRGGKKNFNTKDSLIYIDQYDTFYLIG